MDRGLRRKTVASVLACEEGPTCMFPFAEKYVFLSRVGSKRNLSLVDIYFSSGLKQMEAWRAYHNERTGTGTL